MHVNTMAAVSNSTDVKDYTIPERKPLQRL